MSSVRSSRSGVFNPAYVQRGEIVGQYRIVERLGQGGMGATYLAERDGAPYALKLATFEVGLRPDERRLQVARVKREAGILQQLEHPNIVRTHELGFWPSLEKGYPYIVMDYIEGARITDWRRQVRPSARLLSGVFSKLCRGLEELHRLGIYHRDLKGANVMVRAIDQEPIIIDFGIARAASAKTMTRQLDILGTYVNFPPEYCAWATSGRVGLEQFEHTAVQELWTVGLLAYELFVGTPPFPYRRAQFDMYDAIQRMVPPLPSVANPSVPVALDAIIMSALEKDPASRCQSAAAFAAALDSALEAADASWDEPLALPGDGLDEAVEELGDSAFSIVSAGQSPVRPTRAERNRSPSVPAKHDDDDQAPAVDSFSLSSLGFIVASSGGEGGSDDDGPPSFVSQVDSELMIPAAPPSIVSMGGEAPPSIVSMGGEAPPSIVSQVAPSVSVQAPSPSSQPVPEFVAPSAILTAEKSFVPPEEDEPLAVRKPVRESVDVPSGVRRFAEQLQGKRSRANLPKPVLVGGGLLLLCGAILFLASQGGDVAAAEQGSAAELERLTLESPTALLPPAPAPARAASQAALPDPLPSESAAAARGEIPEVTLAPSSATKGGSRTRKPNADEAGVDDILRESFGGERPVIRASGKLDGSVAAQTKLPAGASFIKTGQRNDSPESDSEGGKLGVPFGAHLRVRLRTPMHSDTVRSGMVEAHFSRPFRSASGEILIQRGSTLYGEAQPDGTTGRFLISFKRLRLPDNSVRDVNAIAVDERDSLPGLRAQRTRPASTNEKNVLTDVAAGAAQTVLGSVTGGLGQDVVRGTGQTLTREAMQGNPQGAGARDTLTLGEGLDFRVVVNQAF